jgi:hypothetical protein
MREWYELAFVPPGTEKLENFGVRIDRERVMHAVREHAGLDIALEELFGFSGLVGLTRAGCYVVSYHTDADVVGWTPPAAKRKGSPSNYTTHRRVPPSVRRRRRSPIRTQDDRAIGAELRAKREAAGISVRELSKRLGLSPAYLSYLERGRRQWSALNRMSYVAMLSLPTTPPTESSMSA